MWGSKQRKRSKQVNSPMLGAEPMAKVEDGAEEGGEEPPGANQREKVAQRHLGSPSRITRGI